MNQFLRWMLQWTKNDGHLKISRTNFCGKKLWAAEISIVSVTLFFLYFQSRVVRWINVHESEYVCTQGWFVLWLRRATAKESCRLMHIQGGREYTVSIAVQKTGTILSGTFRFSTPDRASPGIFCCIWSLCLRERVRNIDHQKKIQKYQHNWEMKAKRQIMLTAFVQSNFR